MPWTVTKKEGNCIENNHIYRNEMRKQVVRLTFLIRLLNVSYSQVLSQDGLTRKPLSALFPFWTGTFLFTQSGERRLPSIRHVDA